MTDTIHIAGVNYPLVAGTQLPSGKRAIQVTTRPSQMSDPSVPREVQWDLHGPIGASREGPDGFLGHDWGTLETRFEDLLLPLGAVNTITLTTGDTALASNPAYFGVPFFGAAATKFGGAVSGANVTHIFEYQSYLVYHRGMYSTPVDPATWTVGTSKLWEAVVSGAEVWKARGYVGQGSSVTVQRIVGIIGGVITSAATTAKYARSMKRGTDRLWFIEASSGNENEVNFTLDDFSNISTSFPVGDPGFQATGLIDGGPYMGMGNVTGVFTFTDDGKASSLIPALRGSQSVINGKDGSLTTSGWTWVITELGIYAVMLGSGIANPAGLSGEDMLGFEGFQATPTAVFPWRESIFVAYSDGTNTWLLRGKFNQNKTPGSGQHDLYPFAYRASTSVEAIFASSTPTNPVITWGEGTNAAYMVQGIGTRDIADSAYVFATSGTWYGTTMMRGSRMNNYLRYFRVFTEDCDSNDTYTIAVSADGAAYTTIGSAINSNGLQTVRPVSGGAPVAGGSFRTIKPRITLSGNSTTTPAKLRGKLAMVYDERPEQIQQVDCVILVGQKGKRGQTEIDALAALVDSSTPIRIRLPDDNPRSNDRFGFVNSVGPVQDIETKDAQGQAVTLRVASVSFLLWDVA